ncbi:hypothetical protein RFI_19206, partial [Reticulomyxa filosa]
DLELERTILKDELQQLKNDPSFLRAHTATSTINEHPQRYSIDLSKFVVSFLFSFFYFYFFYKQKEEKTISTANGIVDEGDTGISPLVVQKMKLALEAAQKMTKNGLSTTPGDNTSIPSQKQNTSDTSTKTSALSSNPEEPNKKVVCVCVYICACVFVLALFRK